MLDTASFSDRLLPGERLVWTGRPKSGVVLTARDVFLLPFSVLWLGFVVFWILSVPSSAGPEFVLFGYAFLAIGATIMLGRFALVAWLRSSTRYAVTDRRVLILRSRPTVDFTALDLNRLPEARLSESTGGRGTIRFGPAFRMFDASQVFAVWSPSLEATPQFIAIEDGRRVFDLIQRGAPAGR